MKNKSKFIRRLSAMLVAVLCVCLLCVPAFASDGEEELLDYGIFEQKDYREIWNGEFARKYPYVVVSSDGKMRFSATKPYANSYSNDFWNCKFPVGSNALSVVLNANASWSPGYNDGQFWCNVPIYDSNGNLIYTPSPVGEVDSETGLRDYGGFYSVDYREILVGSIADNYPIIVVTSNPAESYLYSDVVQTYNVNGSILFNRLNIVYLLTYFRFNPETEWANYNLVTESGEIVYHTYPVPRAFSYVTKYAETLGIQFSVLSLVEVIAYIAGAVVLFVFLWWGVRKAVRVIIAGFKKGKLKL